MDVFSNSHMTHGQVSNISYKIVKNTSNITSSVFDSVIRDALIKLSNSRPKLINWLADKKPNMEFELLCESDMGKGNIGNVPNKENNKIQINETIKHEISASLDNCSGIALALPSWRERAAAAIIHELGHFLQYRSRSSKILIESCSLIPVTSIYSGELHCGSPIPSELWCEALCAEAFQAQLPFPLPANLTLALSNAEKILLDNL